MTANSVGTKTISLLVLIPTVLAYRRRMVGHWRWIFVVGGVVSLYLNFFVLIVQAFERSRPCTPWPPLSPNRLFKGLRSRLSSFSLSSAFSH